MASLKATDSPEADESQQTTVEEEKKDDCDENIMVEEANTSSYKSEQSTCPDTSTTECGAETSIDNADNSVNADVLSVSSDGADDVQKEESQLKKSEKPKRKKRRDKVRVQPNYFVAIPIDSEEIKTGITKVQEALVSHSSNLTNALVSLDKLHLTIHVMRLDEEHCLHDAKAALSDVVNRIRESELFSDREMTLEVVGLKDFNGKVLYADVTVSDKLKKIAEFVHEAFTAAGLASTDDREKQSFTAHLTVAKLSQDLWFMRQKKIKKIPTEAYESLKDTHFGQESVHVLQVCSMMKYPEDDDDLYYYTPLQVKLFSNDDNADALNAETME